MYVEHPFKFDGKYYAKIDNEYIEISKEVAAAMRSFYRNEVYRGRKWAPQDEESEKKEENQTLEEKLEQEEKMEQEEIQTRENNEKSLEQKNEQETSQRRWHWKHKMTEILDCAFSENADGVSLQDMPDETQMTPEEIVIYKEELQMLYEYMKRLTEREQFIVRAVYFDNITKKALGEMLGIADTRVGQILRASLKKIKKMYENDEK